MAGLARDCRSMSHCCTAGTIHHDESQEHGAAGTICEHAGSAHVIT